MGYRKFTLSFLVVTNILFLLVVSAPVAHATTFDLMEVPTYLDTQLGCGEFIGGLLASLALVMLVLLPVMVATKGKNYSLYMVLFFAVAAPLVGLGWFPIWLYIILMLIIGLGLGEKISDYIGGIRK